MTPWDRPVVETLEQEAARLRGLVLSLEKAAERCRLKGCPSYVNCFLIPGSVMPICSRKTRDAAVLKLSQLERAAERAK